MELKTLSTFPGVPFNDTFEEFSNAYTFDEDIECYQLVFCPYGRKTCFDADLSNFKFKSRVVILNIVDSIIDKYDNFALEELTQFCANNPEQNFIIFTYHLSLQDQLKITNLYHDTIFSAYTLTQMRRCEKKDITNNWVFLNRNSKLHKAMAICYLLSKDYHSNGYISTTDESILSKYHQYKNISKMPVEFRNSIADGFKRFKSKEFNSLQISEFLKDDDRVADNYNKNLLPIYRNVALELISGTMFFENSPLLSEKEIQNVYGQNFPIYFNAPGIVKEMKKLFDLDMFEDIIDHSYDQIENHFERLAAAVDRNEKLLNGSTNMKELWYDNRKRFEDNCDKLDAAFYDKTYRSAFNEEKIKKALTHFNVTFVKN